MDTSWLRSPWFKGGDLAIITVFKFYRFNNKNDKKEIKKTDENTQTVLPEIKQPNNMENITTQTNEETITIEASNKWYDDKSKLAWSLLFFPIFLYGLYETRLFGKELKFLIFSAILGLCILANVNSSSNIYGTYKIHSDDPFFKDIINNRSDYFNIMENGNIYFNCDAGMGYSGWDAFGKYTFSSSDNNLHIVWQRGNLPSTLHIDGSGTITIGTSTYIKSDEKKY